MVSSCEIGSEIIPWQLLNVMIFWGFQNLSETPGLSNSIAISSVHNMDHFSIFTVFFVFEIIVLKLVQKIDASTL